MFKTIRLDYIVIGRHSFKLVHSGTTFLWQLRHDLAAYFPLSTSVPRIRRPPHKSLFPKLYISKVRGGQYFV